MDINRNNYESFFLDFAEGNLSADQEERLNNFLKLNPDLENELRDFDLLRLNVDDVHMPSKESLKKRIPSGEELVNDANFEMYSIAYLEGDLDENQRTDFENFLEKEEHFKKKLALMQKTFLQPKTISFPGKVNLKKERGSLFRLKYLIPMAAAAAVALLLMVKTDSITSEREIASLPESVITETKTPETKSPPVQEKAATIQIIRNSRTTVPVSNIKKEPSQVKADQQSGSDQADQKPVKVAALSIPKVEIPEIPFKLERLTPTSSPLPIINASSLAVADRVRYQLNRASGLMDEEDVFIWNLASQGIEEINKLAGTDMSLMASKDQDGYVSGFRFKSRILNVTAPISRDKN